MRNYRRFLFVFRMDDIRAHGHNEGNQCNRKREIVAGDRVISQHHPGEDKRDTEHRTPSALSMSNAPRQFVINTSSFKKSSRFWFAMGILLLLLFYLTANVVLRTLSLLGLHLSLDDVISGHAPRPSLY